MEKISFAVYVKCLENVQPIAPLRWVDTARELPLRKTQPLCSTSIRTNSALSEEPSQAPSSVGANLFEFVSLHAELSHWTQFSRKSVSFPGQ